MKKILILVLACVLSLSCLLPVFALDGDNYSISFSEAVGEGTGTADGKNVSVILVKKDTVVTLKLEADMRAGCLGGATFNSEDLMDPMVWNGTDMVNFLSANTTNTLVFDSLGKYNLFVGGTDYYIEVVDSLSTEKTKHTVTTEEPATWAKPFVDKANELALLPKELNNKYNDNITRAEFCQLIMSLYEKHTGVTAYKTLSDKGIEVINPFSDSDSEYVTQAYLLNIVGGKGNGIFDPQGLLTRQEAAIILMKTAKALDQELKINDSTFADHDAIATWANEGVNYVSSNDIMNGIGDDKFDPQGQYTRQQAIITMIKLFDQLKK